MLPVAILAGGRATRLQQLTERVPKSLLPVAGRPFLFHQLALLRSRGVRRVVLCVGHLGEQIRAAVGDGRGFGLAVSYSFDGATLLGTGGALKRALPLLGREFFVLYGDAYLPCSLTRIESAYFTAGRPALMAVLRNENRWDRSNVVFADGAVVAYDKHSSRDDMLHVDFGISVLSEGVLRDYSDADVFDLSDLCRDLAARGHLAALEMSERFFEIGSLAGMRDTEEYLRAGRALQ